MASTNSPEESSSNPQRPPLTEEEKEIIESDKIGDSAYSKKWVLGVLMHLLQDMSREKENRNKKDGDDDDDFDKNGDTIENGEVIDLNLEQQLCELWDMTMDAVSLSKIDFYFQKMENSHLSIYCNGPANKKK